MSAEESVSDVYTCARCGAEFEREDDWTDADAKAEALANGFTEADGRMAIVCDVCYRAFMGWWAGLAVRRCDVRRFDHLRMAWQVANDRRFSIVEQWQMVRLCLKRFLFGRSSVPLQG